ncbi:MAG: ACT domain-containing protein [Polyangiaceae bacterium]|nr:ACT domain-containing protein [Polyangiaceae bacterium]
MTQRTKIDELTKRLDDLDRELLGMIERRARIVQDMSSARGDSAKVAPISDPAKLRSLEEAVTPPFQASSVRPIFAAIDAACRVYEIAPKVVCVGSEGGFSWLAAGLHFGPRAQFVRAESPEKALEEVARSQADFAVVTIETLREGLAFATIQAIASLDLKLVGERELSHTLQLVSKTGNPNDVERIYANSHHHSLCEAHLTASYPKATVLHVRNAMMAADLAAEHHGAAAVVPRGLTTSQELRLLADNVGDEGELRIRYGIVSRMPMSRTGNDATAVLFSVHDRPGALHDVLQAFKEKNCNLRRIQSRALPGEGWEYVFYVEVSGHVTDRHLVSALEGVKQKARTLKIVGSFPLDTVEPAVPSSGAGSR